MKIMMLVGTLFYLAFSLPGADSASSSQSGPANNLGPRRAANQDNGALLPALHNFRFSLEIGYSQMMNDDKDTLSEFYRDINNRLRQASNFILSISTYLRGNIGLGLFYSRYSSDASLDVKAYALSLDRDTIRGVYRENFSINYFGPTLGIKSKPQKGRLVFLAELRPGMVLFFDDISYSNVMKNLSSPVFGLGGSVGAEYLLGRGMGLGLSVNGLYATVSRLTNAEGISHSADKNISRLDLNIGLKYHLTRR
jgi:hypothetical protein